MSNDVFLVTWLDMQRPWSTKLFDVKEKIEDRNQNESSNESQRQDSWSKEAQYQMKA